MTTIDDRTSVSTFVDVAAPIEHAFAVFTDLGRWWDDDKHILAAPLAEMVLEPRVGGRIIDRGVDGSECAWARVLAYDPPRRLCFSWDINTSWQLETDPTKCSEVDIIFVETSPGRTRVTLTHRHLDRHGDGWQSMRDAVGSGWSLTHFAEVAGASATDSAEDAETILGRLLPTVTDEQMRARLGGAAAYTVIVLKTTGAFVRPEVDPDHL